MIKEPLLLLMTLVVLLGVEARAELLPVEDCPCEEEPFFQDEACSYILYCSKTSTLTQLFEGVPVDLGIGSKAKCIHCPKGCPGNPVTDVVAHCSQVFTRTVEVSASVTLGTETGMLPGLIAHVEASGEVTATGSVTISDTCGVTAPPCNDCTYGMKVNAKGGALWECEVCYSIIGQEVGSCLYGGGAFTVADCGCETGGIEVSLTAFVGECKFQCSKCGYVP